MAIRGPLLVKDTTSTTGTSTYVYNRVATNGYRTIADAIADGSLANGDQVYYIVRDTTAAGSGNMFEAGLGTIDSAAFTLTRDQVIQSSNAGAAVSWGAGTRDLYVVTIYESLALLAKANTFTLLQKIVLGGSAISPSAATGLLVQNSPLTTSTVHASIIAGNAGESWVMLGDTDSEIGAGRVGYKHSTSRLEVWAGGAERARIATAGWTTPANVPYEAFPVGTKLLFGTAPPTGWTRVDATEDRVLRLAKSAETVGNAAGSWTVTGLTTPATPTDVRVLTTANLASHNHASNIGSGTGATSGIRIDSATLDLTTLLGANTGLTGSGTGHDHAMPSMAVASDGAWRPRMEIWAAATKN